MVHRRHVILAHSTIGAEIVAALRQRYEVVEGDPDRWASGVAEAVRAIVTLGMMRTDRELMDRLPALGLICCTGSGYEGVDRRAAAERGIAVTHGPDTNASAVADLAIGLLLATVRGIAAGDRLVRQGRWIGADVAVQGMRRGLTGRRLGIFGLGTIGEKIARRAEALEMTVAYHNRRPRAGATYRYVPDLAGLAAWADVLVVAARAGPANRHAVDRDILTALGPEGYLVNIARGSVVDEGALVDALRENRIAGAGLDVFENEPAVPVGLTGSDRVVLTPHIGGATTDAHERIRDLLLENLAAFMDGRALVSPVPEETGP